MVLVGINLAGQGDLSFHSTSIHPFTCRRLFCKMVGSIPFVREKISTKDSLKCHAFESPEKQKPDIELKVLVINVTKITSLK